MEVQEGVGTGLLGAALIKVIEAVARAFGTRTERAEANVAESASTERAADLAMRIAEQERDETERARIQRDDCHARLEVMASRLTKVEGEARICDARSRRQVGEIAWMRRAIEALQRGDTMPPPKADPPNLEVEIELEET